MNDQSRTLILGTMPSEESIKRNQYYGNPRNQFWKIMEHLFNIRADLPYQTRVKCLLEHGIALWDILKSCERSGSLDNNIRKEVNNNLESFLAKHQSIRRIAFNGKNPTRYTEKFHPSLSGKSRVDILILPSSSPANTHSLDEKIQEWREIRS